MICSQGLRREIAELETLLESAPDDAESRWACYLLRHCLDHRRARLQACQHAKATGAKRGRRVAARQLRTRSGY